MRRRVLAVVLLSAFAAGNLRAEPRAADHALLAPVPLGAAPGTFQQPPSTPPQASPAPAPKLRPAIASRPVTRTTKKQPSTQPRGLGGLGDAVSLTDRPPVLSRPTPQAMDLSKGLDLGGVSLGLDTGHDNDNSGTKNLLSPEARDPVPSDPTLIKKGTPFLGLSLSAPTN